MSHVDQITQQNASGAEELAATAQDMEQQSEALLALVGGAARIGHGQVAAHRGRIAVAAQPAPGRYNGVGQPDRYQPLGATLAGEHWSDSEEPEPELDATEPTPAVRGDFRRCRELRRGSGG